MEENTKITKANALIKASYRLSLIEMQVILYGVSLINPLSGDFPVEIKIKISEFAETFKRDISTVYRDIKNAILGNFWERDIRFDTPENEIVKLRWLSKITYHKGDGFFSLGFSEHIRPYLHNLSKNFTSYRVKEVSDLRSSHSIRLYEVFIMELNKTRTSKVDIILTVDELKDRLDLLDKYTQYYSLRERVIKKARKEINEYSDICCNYEEIKRGKGVKSIRFIINKKHQEEQQELDLNTTSVDAGGDEAFNTDTSPMSEEEFTKLMHKNDLKVRLFSYRVAEKVACQLLRDYGFEQIESALNYTDNVIKQGKEIKNKPAYLVNAIKEGY